MISLINVFTVDPANQHRLLDLLARATDEFVSRAPGFITSTLHRSLDGTKVTMYAQWRSAEAYEAMRRDPGPLPFLKEALTITKFEPGMYGAHIHAHRQVDLTRVRESELPLLAQPGHARAVRRRLLLRVERTSP